MAVTNDATTRTIQLVLMALVSTTAGYRQHLSPKKPSSLTEVIGFDWGGSIIEYQLVPFASLDGDGMARFWERWSELCSWYQILGGSRPIQRLKNRSESIAKQISQLRLEPQSQTVSNQIQSLNEEKRNLEGHIKFLQVLFHFHSR